MTKASKPYRKPGKYYPEPIELAEPEPEPIELAEPEPEPIELVAAEPFDGKRRTATESLADTWERLEDERLRREIAIEFAHERRSDANGRPLNYPHMHWYDVRLDLGGVLDALVTDPEFIGSTPEDQQHARQWLGSITQPDSELPECLGDPWPRRRLAMFKRRRSESRYD